MEIGDKNILPVIAKHIDDSVTWCRFSQVNRTCYELCKKLLRHETLYSKYFKHREYRTTLPCGVLHGEVKGEIEIYNMYRKTRHWYFWYSKVYKSNELHGYYTVGDYRRCFENGVETEEKFLVHKKAISLNNQYLQILEPFFKTKVAGRYLIWKDFEYVTKSRNNYHSSRYS